MENINDYKSTDEDNSKLRKKTLILYGISTALLYCLSAAIYIIYSIYQKKKNNVASVKILLFLILGSTILSLVISGIYRTLNYKSEKQYNKYSESRMEQIDKVFQSYLGPKWPYVILSFGFFLLAYIFMVYFGSSKIEINIDNEENFQKIVKILVWFGVIFTIGVMALFLTSYKKYQDRQTEIKETEGDLSNYTKGKQLINIIGVVIGTIITLLVLIVIVINFLKNRKKQS